MRITVVNTAKGQDDYPPTEPQALILWLFGVFNKIPREHQRSTRLEEYGDRLVVTYDDGRRAGQ